MKINNRKKYHNSRQSRSNNRICHLRSSGDHCLLNTHSFFLIPENTFYNYNGIIYQHTRSESQPSQSHNIQRKPIEKHQIESCYNRDWNRKTDNQRCSHSTKEYKQYNDSKDNTQYSTAFHFTDSTFYKSPLIGDYLKMIAGQSIFYHCQPTSYFVYHLHRIETHFLINRQTDTTFSINTYNVFGTCIHKLHSSYFFQKAGSLVDICHSFRRTIP